MTDLSTDQRDKRNGVIIHAAVTVDGRTTERRVRNLSLQGACIDHSGDLAEGTTLRLSMGTLADLRATVMWTRPQLAGLQFDRPIDLDAARRPRAAAGASAKAGWMAEMNHAYRRQG
jgi:hypothetical protein